MIPAEVSLVLLFYLFIYGLLNDIVSSSHCKPFAPNDRMINEQLFGKDMEGNRHGVIYGTVPILTWRD
jgi:hypothetical protein